jgi:orotate phosphoribosyltransferase|tara:strand:+ start:3383 stop:3937 length:555 start_codon:yes stop_codon:yes gene_type:complete
MQDFLEKAIELEALKFGSFKLKSGIDSNYFFNISAFFDSESLSFLAECYVSEIIKLELDFNLFFGPAYKGIPLASAVAIKYFEITNKKIPIAFDRKEEKLHGEGGLIMGDIKNKKVLLIDDVLTAGTAIKNSIEVIEKNGASFIGALVALDREEKYDSDKSYKEFYRHQGINIYSLGKISDLKV